MFIAALFIITPNWKPPIRPSIREWINKLCYVRIMGYNSEIKTTDHSWQYRWISQTLCWTIEARHKRVCIVWLHFYDIQEQESGVLTSRWKTTDWLESEQGTFWTHILSMCYVLIWVVVARTSTYLNIEQHTPDWYILCIYVYLHQRKKWGGAWVAQSVKRLTSAQVMVSRFMGSSPTSGSVLTARSLEPASDSVSPLCPSSTHTLSLSLEYINI